MVKHALNLIRSTPRLSATTLIVAAIALGVPAVLGSTLITRTLARTVAPSCTVSESGSVTITLAGAGAKAGCAELAKKYHLKASKPATDVVCDFDRKDVEVTVRTTGWDPSSGLFTCWVLGDPQMGRS